MSEEKLAICIGSQKAGTTTLYASMQQHPNVCVTLKKESGFFYYDDIYANGYDWFLKKNFPKYSTNTILFEADPNYIYFNKCIKRIHKCNPETMIIVMLRNPVDRAFSHYLMMRKWALENLSFQDACNAEPNRISQGEWQRADFGYLDRSRYAVQIENLLNIFSKNQVYFILFEDFIKEQSTHMLKIQEWLGLPVITLKEKTENISSSPRIRFLTELLHQPKYKNLRELVGKMLGGNKNLNYFIGKNLEAINQNPHKKLKRPTMDAHLRRELLSDLHEDITKVESLTGLDVISAWNR